MRSSILWKIFLIGFHFEIWAYEDSNLLSKVSQFQVICFIKIGIELKHMENKQQTESSVCYSNISAHKYV